MRWTFLVFGCCGRPQAQMDWFVSELQKPADLRLVFNGGPNFEYDYSYAALTDFPGAKKEFIDALRRSGAEKVRAGSCGSGLDTKAGSWPVNNKSSCSVGCLQVLQRKASSMSPPPHSRLRTRTVSLPGRAPPQPHTTGTLC